MASLAVIIRWTARYFAAVVAAIAFIIFVGEAAGAENLRPPYLSMMEFLMTVFYFTTWVGLIVGWFKEWLGGAMIIFGLAAFYLTEYIALGTWPGGLLFLYILFPGVLYIISDRLKEYRPQKAPVMEDLEAAPTAAAQESSAGA